MEARGHHVGVHPSFVYEIALPRAAPRTVASRGAARRGGTTRAREGLSLFLRPSRDSSHYLSLTVPRRRAEKKSRARNARIPGRNDLPPRPVIGRSWG